jgi:hypothetical protein
MSTSSINGIIGRMQTRSTTRVQNYEIMRKDRVRSDEENQQKILKLIKPIDAYIQKRVNVVKFSTDPRSQHDHLLVEAIMLQITTMYRNCIISEEIYKALKNASEPIILPGTILTLTALENDPTWTYENGYNLLTVNEKMYLAGYGVETYELQQNLDSNIYETYPTLGASYITFMAYSDRQQWHIHDIHAELNNQPPPKIPAPRCWNNWPCTHQNVAYYYMFAFDPITYPEPRWNFDTNLHQLHAFIHNLNELYKKHENHYINPRKLIHPNAVELLITIYNQHNANRNKVVHTSLQYTNQLINVYTYPEKRYHGNIISYYHLDQYDLIDMLIVATRGTDELKFLTNCLNWTANGHPKMAVTVGNYNEHFASFMNSWVDKWFFIAHHFYNREDNYMQFLDYGTKEKPGLFEWVLHSLGINRAFFVDWCGYPDAFKETNTWTECWKFMKTGLETLSVASHQQHAIATVPPTCRDDSPSPFSTPGSAYNRGEGRTQVYGHPEWGYDRTFGFKRAIIDVDDFDDFSEVDAESMGFPHRPFQS